MKTDMETLSDTKIINQMLTVEKMACQVIERAKEEGTGMITAAREEAGKLIEKTKQNLNNDIHTLEKRLQEETEKELVRIKAENQHVLEMIEKQTKLKKELTIKKVRNFLFKQILDDLC